MALSKDGNIVPDKGKKDDVVSTVHFLRGVVLMILHHQQHRVLNKLGVYVCSEWSKNTYFVVCTTVDLFGY